MNPTVRLLAAFALIAFLVVFGLLAAMQELRTSNIVDPVIAEKLGTLIFPVEPIGDAKPYQSQDYREKFGMASAYYRTGEGGPDDVLMILSSMRPENFRNEGDWDQGLSREWEKGDFSQIGSGFNMKSFLFKGMGVQGQAKVFTDSNGAQRNQFVIPVRWGEQMVWVQVNGPASVVSVEAVQAMLDSATAEPQPLLPPDVEAAGTGTANPAAKEPTSPSPIGQ